MYFFYKKATIVVFCAVGGRSSKAVDALKSMGYSKVRRSKLHICVFMLDPLFYLLTHLLASSCLISVSHGTIRHRLGDKRRGP